MQSQNRHTGIKKHIISFLNSIWLFPAILTLILITLSSLSINGSSIGVYHQILYGDANDKSLIANKPAPIRSDEWLVSSQKAIAQKNNNFETVNNNIANGEDESLIGDSPVKDWSVLLKPQNIGFLIFPFDNAFALRWWLLSYFLVLSSYFFVLYFLPGKRLLASLLSLIFLFSPFFQWWYTYGTFSPIYYALFGFVILTNLIKSKKNTHAVLWSLLLTYVAACFAVILYPPFQIPVALVAAVLCGGYILNKKGNLKSKVFRVRMLYVAISLTLAGLIVGVFLYQRHDVVSTIQNTAYPGQRVSVSGGYSGAHLLANGLGGLLQVQQKADNYKIASAGALNQSESSNFILLIPALLIPMLFLSYTKYKRDRKADFYIIGLLGIGALFSAWLFIPGLDTVGKITLLSNVPINRTLVGIGLLNFVFIIYFIKLYTEKNTKRLALYPAIAYFLLLVIFYLVINLYISKVLPGFISFKLAIILALPIPLVTFLLMRKHFKSGLVVLALFSFLSVFQINPLYRGTSVLTKTPLLSVIKQINGNSTKKWVSEDIVIENFASMAGAHSLTGAQLYPQNDVWAKLGQENNISVYNRYAHVNFSFDRDPNTNIKPVLTNPGMDQLNIRLEPCGDFFKMSNVGFLVTSVPINKDAANCLSFVKKVKYPAIPFYIYSVKL